MEVIRFMTESSYNAGYRMTDAEYRIFDICLSGI